MGRHMMDGDTAGGGLTGAYPNPVVSGMPPGGTTDQVLAKTSGADYDTVWINQSGGTSSGHIIQEDGVNLTARTKLNFSTGVTATDNSGADSSDVTINYGTTSGTAAQGNDSRITGALQAANNLSDVGSAASARASLSLNNVTNDAQLKAADLDTDTTLAADSASKIPSQHAVKSYVDTGLALKQAALGYTPEDVANKSTATALGTSDTLYPSQKAVKTYVDSVATGIAAKPTAVVATTTTLPANTYSNGTAGLGATLTATATGTLTVDGYAVALNDYVLVKNEAAPANNGLYKCTTAGAGGVAYVLTRAVEMDTTAEYSGAFIPVGASGATNANTIWLCNPSGTVTVGTTAIPFTQLNPATNVSGGTGISVAANVVSLQTPVTVANGGTNATTASAARTSLVVQGYGRTNVNNTNYTILTTDIWVSQNGFISASRTFTLPAASAVPAGWQIIIGDESGLVTATKSIVIARAGSDLIDGATSYTISEPYGIRRLISNGGSKWTVVNGPFVNSVGDISMPTPIVDSSRGNALIGGGIKKTAGVNIVTTIDQTKGAIWARVVAASDGGNIVNIASWANPSPGVLSVDQSLASIGAQTSGQLELTAIGAIINYTGLSGTTFTGCTLVSGSGTIHTNDYVMSVVADANADTFLGSPLNIINTQTIDYNGGTLGPTPYTLISGAGAPRAIINLEGTLAANYSIGAITGQAPHFQTAMYVTSNNNSNIAAAEAFVNAQTVWATAAGVTNYPDAGATFNAPGENQGWDMGYWDGVLHKANYLGNGGTLEKIQTVGYVSTSFMGDGSRGLRRYGFLAGDINLSGDGSMVTQIGVAIGKMAHDGFTFSTYTGATNNIGLLNAATTVLPSSSVQNVSANFTVTADASHITLLSTTGVSATTTGPVIAVPDSTMYGQVVHLVNGSTAAASHSLLFTSSVVCKLHLGAATRSLGNGGTLSLIYNNTTGRWCEIGFSN